MCSNCTKKIEFYTDSTTSTVHTHPLKKIVFDSFLRYTVESAQWVFLVSNVRQFQNGTHESIKEKKNM